MESRFSLQKPCVHDQIQIPPASTPSRFAIHRKSAFFITSVNAIDQSDWISIANPMSRGQGLSFKIPSQLRHEGEKGWGEGHITCCDLVTRSDSNALGQTSSLASIHRTSLCPEPFTLSSTSLNFEIETRRPVVIVGHDAPTKSAASQPRFALRQFLGLLAKSPPLTTFRM